jgi:hypothetical protein
MITIPDRAISWVLRAAAREILPGADYAFKIAFDN